MRVLHVVNLVSEDWSFGGPVTVAQSQVRHLSGRGVDVAIAGLRRGQVDRPAGIAPDKVNLFVARTIVPKVGMLGLGSPSLLRFLWAACRRYDVLHVHAGRDLVSLCALLVAALRRTPVVAQTHGMIFARQTLQVRLFDLLFLPLLRRASTIFYLNEGERDTLSGLLGPGVRLVFLGNGMEPVEPSPPRVTPGPPVVVFAARLHPVKGVVAFAEMAAELRDRGVDARFEVYGADQGDLVNLERVVRERHLDDVLRYGGGLPHAQALQAIAAADVLVLASSFEPGGMPVLEAMSSGVPVVVTTGTPLATPLREADAAKVTDGSPGALADAVQSLLEDEAERERLAVLGPKIVQERFSVDAVVDVLQEHYEAAAGS
jgi:glycosyltransferase involved in cell wall biosynthesis